MGYEKIQAKFDLLCLQITHSIEWLHRSEDVSTVQINSNLTLARVSLAETRLIFKFAHNLVVSAGTCLG